MHAPGPARRAAWISASPPATGVARLAEGWTAGLRGRPGFCKVFFDKANGRLEEIRPDAPPVELARGYTGLGRSAFLYGLRKRVPAYDAYFVESQNLAFLRLPRACIVAADLFYLTHPGSPWEKLQGRLFYAGLRDYQAVMAISHYTKSELVKLGVPAERVHVFHLAYDRALFRPAPADREKLWAELGLDPKARMIFHVSSGEERKNFGGLLRAVARLAKDVPEVVLVKAGRDLRGRTRARTEALAERLGLAGRVKYLGQLPDARLAELYRACDCFAFPSFAEGFGLPALEAQACGCPTVVSNLTSLPEVAGPLARQVDPGDVGALAGALAAQLGDAGLRERAAAANGKWLEGFSWEPGARFLEGFLGLPPA